MGKYKVLVIVLIFLILVSIVTSIIIISNQNLHIADLTNQLHNYQLALSQSSLSYSSNSSTLKINSSTSSDLSNFSGAELKKISFTSKPSFKSTNWDFSTFTNNYLSFDAPENSFVEYGYYGDLATKDGQEYLTIRNGVYEIQVDQGFGRGDFSCYEYNFNTKIFKYSYTDTTNGYDTKYSQLTVSTVPFESYDKYSRLTYLGFTKLPEEVIENGNKIIAGRKINNVLSTCDVVSDFNYTFNIFKITDNGDGTELKAYTFSSVFDGTQSGFNKFIEFADRFFSTVKKK